MTFNVNGPNNVEGTNNVGKSRAVQRKTFLNTVFGGEAVAAIIPKGNPLTQENLAYLMPMALLPDDMMLIES